MMPLDPYGTQTRWVGIGSGGPKDTTFKAYPSEGWLQVTPDHGSIRQDGSSDMRVNISVDWTHFDKEGPAQGTVVLAASDGSNVTITVPAVRPLAPSSNYHGFVQGDDYVVMEAAHFKKNVSASEYAYHEIEGYGRTLSGVSMYPVTAYNFTLGKGPSLTYNFWAHASSNIDITVQIAPSNNFILDHQLAFGLQLDSQKPQMMFPIPLTSLLEVSQPGENNRAKEIGAVPSDWINVVSSEIRNVTLSANLTGAGEHELTIWGMSAGIVLERIWVDFGGIKARGWSYLGPPESKRV